MQEMWRLLYYMCTTNTRYGTAILCISNRPPLHLCRLQRVISVDSDGLILHHLSMSHFLSQWIRHNALVMEHSECNVTNCRHSIPSHCQSHTVNIFLAQQSNTHLLSLSAPYTKCLQSTSNRVTDAIQVRSQKTFLLSLSVSLSYTRYMQNAQKNGILCKQHQYNMTTALSIRCAEIPACLKTLITSLQW